MHKNKIYLLIIAGLIVVLGYEVWSVTTRSNSLQQVAPDANQVVMYKNAGCQCCSRWAGHMQQTGFKVKEKPTDRLPAIKKQEGVPYAMRACHTALVSGYVVEGHVPIADVKRLLREKPDARGIAVPGMPQGSPGMETGQKEHYKVYLIHTDGTQTVFAKH